MITRSSIAPARRRVLPALIAVAALLGGPAAPRARAADKVATQVLFSTGADPDATATATWTQGLTSTTFAVEVEHMTEGGFDVVVAGVAKGAISVDATGHGKLLFVTPADALHPLFDFAVFNQQIVVSQGMLAFFVDVFQEPVTVQKPPPIETFGVFLVPVGADLGTHGKLTFKKQGTQKTFTVEVDGLPAGTNDLSVDGAVVAQIVTTGAPGSSTKLEFQDPASVGVLPLGFDAPGMLVTVGVGGQALLAAVLPASVDTSGVVNPQKPAGASKNIGKLKSDGLLVHLANVGLIGGVTGTATLSDGAAQALVIDVKHLPAGTSFDLVVDGLTHGALVPDGKGHAQITFGNPLGNADALLDFAVKGKLLEVQFAGDPALSSVFPVSVQGALGTFPKETHKPKHVFVSLVNAGVDLDASGTAEWKQKQSGEESLVIKIKDLAPGNYDVLVDGVLLGNGALTVKKEGGAAKVVFDTQPKPSGLQLPLAVPVSGHTVTITPDADDATVLLSTLVD